MFDGVESKYRDIKTFLILCDILFQVTDQTTQYMMWSLEVIEVVSLHNYYLPQIPLFIIFGSGSRSIAAIRSLKQRPTILRCLLQHVCIGILIMTDGNTMGAGYV